MSSPDDRPLRLGLLVDDLRQPAWVVSMLSEILDEGIVTLALVVLNRSPSLRNVDRRFTTRVGRWAKNRAHLPFALYNRLDALRYKPRQDPFEGRDLTPLIGDAPILDVVPLSGTFVDRFDDDSVSAIDGYALDVALLLGFRIIKGKALTIARHGIWSYHHGDNRLYRGGPANFWEVYHGRLETGAVLQVLTEDLDGGHVLARSRSRTNLLSVVGNKAGSYMDASALLKRELSFLQREGSASFTRITPREAWSAYSQPIYRAPRVKQVAQVAARVTVRLLLRKMRSLRVREQWFLLYCFGPITDGSAAEIPSGLPYRYRSIIPPSDRSWADPFPVSEDGRHFVFFEEYCFDHKHAHIAMFEIGPDHTLHAPRTVLARPHHLSYPFLFRWDKNWYMMPECRQSQTVEIFKAKRFPDEWESIGPVLHDVHLVDPTLAEIDGRWWMFSSTRIHPAGDAVALNLYYSMSPLGPWTPHMYNPVKIDIQGARPAGRLFKQGAAWYRPGQDGTRRYGSAIVIHRIEEISPTRFSEVVVDRIEPNWEPGLTGVHTINAAAGLSMLDARRPVSRLPGRRSHQPTDVKN